jgi:hypothetical protein
VLLLCKILYSKSWPWYDLSDVGYLNHLVNILSVSSNNDDDDDDDDDEQGNIFSNVNTIIPHP